MKNLLFLTVFCIITANLFGQKEGNIWYYGVNAGINFNDSEPFIDNNNEMDTFEGCATICDASGELLFYTNGGGRAAVAGPRQGTIWNKNDSLMYDMAGFEGGGYSSRQSSIIVPKSGVPDQYYLFTMDEVEALADSTPGRGFSYFKIDMNQNSGLGGVVNYQESVELDSYEFLSACIHANGLDHWVVIYNNVTDSLNMFSVNTNGVNLVHTTSIPTNNLQGAGLIKFSPDGSKMVTKNVLFDFDNLTGQLSNPIIIDPTQEYYGVSFSPSSQYLYVVNDYSSNPTIVRYDVTVPNVLGSLEVIASSFGNFIALAQMQVAPDGNIYFLEQNPIAQRTDLSVIQCANSLSPCVESGITSYPNTLFFGLPNFTDHIFANSQIGNTLPISIQIDDLSQLCQGLNTDLSINAGPDYDILWSTGEVTSSIQISLPGIYTVTVNDGCCNTRTDTMIVTCETTNTEELVKETDIKIFPNPAKGKVFIEGFSELSPIQEVEIFSIDARFITKETGGNIQEIDVSALENGVYLLRLVTQDGTTINKRVVKF